MEHNQEVEVVLQARTPEVADLIEACARHRISLVECCKGIAALGFKTTSVYEMVVAKEQEINHE